MISQKNDIYLALHNIRSTHNVGSIFRTADAAGIDKIYLCGYTPCPIDRFGRSRKDIAKVALGAEKTIEWEYCEDIKELIKKMKKSGVNILALEQSPGSIDYKEVKVSSKNLLILGPEVKGIEEEILKECDEIIEIPMSGEKESLNVSVATGIVLFRLISN